MSRRTGRGGRPRHLDHRGGPRPHDATRIGRPTAAAAPGEPAWVETGPQPDGGETGLPANGAGPARDPALIPSAETVGSVPGEPGSLAPERPAVPDHELSVQGASMVPDADGTTAPRATPGLGEPLDRPAAHAEPGNGRGPHGPTERSGGCTTAQLRRFIKSRAYVPIHEIRRRFLIATEDDDVSGIELGSGRVYIGLPEREGQMLGELLRGGEVGYELQLDPMAPVVIGVYPMRPVTRT